MTFTDIIMLLYGDRSDLDRCIASIEKYCHDYELHIIDNNPPNENLGFTKAINRGIQAGKAPYIWLINQDAIIVDDLTQQALIDRFSYNDKVGIAGSMQIDYDDHDMIRHGGTIRAFPAGAHKGGRISMGHCRVPEKNTWVNFASVMLRRQMVEDIGPLDESMYLLYSDSDYCYYARSKGYEVWYEPRSKVFHRLNASGKVTEWHEKDMKAFMQKWGITHVSDGRFQYSPEFHKLDMFP